MANYKLIEFNKSDHIEILKLNLYPSLIDNNKILLMVGGSGDDRNHFKPIFDLIQAKFPDLNIVSFSFRGYETGVDYPPRQQVTDLEEVLEFITTKFTDPQIYLACTSYGAFSSVFALTNPKYSQLFRQAIFLDPADYYLKDLDSNSEPTTWDGNMKFLPTSDTTSSMLSNLNSAAIIDIVHFTIRNFKPGGWGSTPYLERGVDDPKLFTRLSTSMVRSFYDHTPPQNRGRYLEVANLPHAFMRDGDINKNIRNVTGLIIKLLNV